MLVYPAASIWWLKLPNCRALPGLVLRLCSFKVSGQTYSIQSSKVIPIFPRVLIFMELEFS